MFMLIWQSSIDFACGMFIFGICIVENRPYFVPHTIPYNVFKFSTVPIVT